MDRPNALTPKLLRPKHKPKPMPERHKKPRLLMLPPPSKPPLMPKLLLKPPPPKLTSFPSA